MPLVPCLPNTVLGGSRENAFAIPSCPSLITYHCFTPLREGFRYVRQLHPLLDTAKNRLSLMDTHFMA
jgi:hypothetical protein